MAAEVAVTLPRGLFDRDGGRHRDAVLRPVTGHFEARLAEAPSLRPGAISDLLAGVIARIGGYDDVTAEHAAALSRGDRDFALLHLRRSLFGDRLDLVVRCPNPSCRDEADLSLRISELAADPEDAAPETFEVDTPSGIAVVREPTGADDSAVDGLPRDAASDALWSRIVVDLCGAGPLDEARWRALDPATRWAIAVALADTASGPTLAFAAPCPACRAWMEIELDPATLVADELGVAVDRLFAEVHTLAYFYHWSEEAILSLPRARRWRYLDLLHRQIAGRDLTGGKP